MSMLAKPTLQQRSARGSKALCCCRGQRGSWREAQTFAEKHIISSLESYSGMAPLQHAAHSAYGLPQVQRIRDGHVHQSRLPRITEGDRVSTKLSCDSDLSDRVDAASSCYVANEKEPLRLLREPGSKHSLRLQWKWESGADH